MCALPVVPSAVNFQTFYNSAVPSKCTLFGASFSHRIDSIDAVDELQTESLLLKCNYAEEAESQGSSTKSNSSYLYRCQLEEDVQKLQQQLFEEMELNAILKKATEKHAKELSSPSCLTKHAQELQSTIAALEVAIPRLEKEMISLNFQLRQERNERKLAEYRLKNLSNRLICLHPPDSIEAPELRDRLECKVGASLKVPVTECQEKVSLVAYSHKNEVSVDPEVETSRAADFKKLPREMQPKGLWESPNLLSEEMVRHMQNIFISLADSSLTVKSSSQEIKTSSLSLRGHRSSSSWWLSERFAISSWTQSPQVDIQRNSDVLASENVYDPYRMHGKLSWADIGNYGSATEVSWVAVGKQRMDYAAAALREFRTLIELLAKANPTNLSSDEKLAFWINLYNALVMHAYVAYGIPRSDMKLFSLLQKAAYTVGGHSYSAATIEYVILKMKPPLHRPQIALLLALHKLKVSEDQCKSAIDTNEPLVNFALSCGMYSSPAVRIYTPKNIYEELHEAQRDFIRASVGVSSKGKLLVPKMLHCFARSFVDDANLAVWISHYLPAHQAAFIEKCISKRRKSLLVSRSCGILPFDSRFRYLFLPSCGQCD